MINTVDFSKRLHKILDYYQLSASSFADKLGVGRSSISHILSGRNKPSLDFVLKLVEQFPEVDLYWLTDGQGHFPKTQKKETLPSQGDDLFSTPTSKASELLKTENKIPLQQNLPLNETKKVEKIILLYEDGTFHIYQA